MKKTIGIVLPSIRPYKINNVIEDLCKQTVKPDKVIVVDNGCNIDNFDFRLLLDGFELICFGKNMGCNYVWNMMWDLDTDYVGAVADDLRFGPYLIETLSESLEMKFGDKPTGGVTASVLQFGDHRHLPKRSSEITGVPVRAKGKCGAILFKRCTLECIPKIPDVFFNYFGDNLIEYWMNILELNFVKINTFVAHNPHTNKEFEMEKFKGWADSERGYWKDYIRGKGDIAP